MVSAEVPADSAAAPAAGLDVEDFGVDPVEPPDGCLGAAAVLAVEALGLVVVGLGFSGARHVSPFVCHLGTLMGRNVDHHVLGSFLRESLDGNWPAPDVYASERQAPVMPKRNLVAGLKAVTL